VKVKKGAVRALVAGIMMVLFLVLFLDVHPPFTGFLGQSMAWIQFFPAMVSAISGTFKGVIAFLVLVLLCLLFGRIYCAVLCPLGIFQDIMIFFSRRRGKQGRKEKLTTATVGTRVENKTLKNQLLTTVSSVTTSSSGTYPFLWYAILIFTTTLLLSGSLFLVNILDPFSIFGRFASQIFLPLSATLNNVLVSLTESFGQYVFSPVNLRPVLWSVFWISYGWFVLVIFMAFYHGRLYCNTLCPVGAFLSLLSNRSLFKFVIDTQKCTTCGKCQRMCRSHCMDPAMGKIDGARCVSCFDCMDVCPENAIGYTMMPLEVLVKGGDYDQTAASANPAELTNPNLSTNPPPPAKPGTQGNAGANFGDLPFLASSVFRGADPMKKNGLSGAVEKRQFLFTALAICGGVLATVIPLRPLLARMARVETTPNDPISPPGSLGIDHFSHTCLACQACVSACVENVLLPGPNAYGMTGALQPRLDFSISRCAYTCHACTLVCPSGAILPLSLKDKQRTRIGSVRFEKDKCLVYTQKRDCGACAEVCPTHAVHTVRENNIHHPRLTLDACIGCGACQLVCPVNPKAIYVVAVKIHEKAGPPFFQQDPPAAPSDVMGSGADFPF